jgi:hypothetical protein
MPLRGAGMGGWMRGVAQKGNRKNAGARLPVDLTA